MDARFLTLPTHSDQPPVSQFAHEHEAEMSILGAKFRPNYDFHASLARPIMIERKPKTNPRELIE